MDNKDYLDFDEAVLYMKTTSSTLYKWLQAGKVPGHKLGRQWRFLREELDLFISGKFQSLNFQKEKMQLAQLLESKNKTKEGFMELQTQGLAEKIIWDAFDNGSRQVHIYPAKGKYEISYRTRKGMDILTMIQEELFQEIDKAFYSESQPIGGEKTNGDSRRFYLHREQKDNEALQIRYQKLETVVGARLTLSISQPEKDVLELEKIVNSEEKTLQIFKQWTKAQKGLIFVTGLSGSGKTTTIYSLLNEFKNQGKLVFTIESPVQLIIEGIQQVELRTNSKEKFSEVFEQVYASDPDVIGLGLALPYGIEEQFFSAAYKAASTGQVVVVQMNQATIQEAKEYFQKFCPYPIEKILIGACSQKLVIKNERLTVEYQFS